MRLPQSVQEIADVIGREQALLLIGQLPRSYTRDKRYPGAKNSTVSMYVPTVARLGLDHPYVRILGWPDALKLSQAFGGEIMYPANCAFIHREFVHKTILALVRTGMKATQVAAIVGCHERTVRNLIRENPPEESPVASNDNRQTQQLATA